MIQNRKEQLHKKLHQIYENGAGRTEGIIDSLLQESFLGHIYFIHGIGETIEYPPCEEWDTNDKDYTLVKFGLYQEGNGCIEIFSVPVSTKVLNDIATRIDAAYYHWMQREPQSVKRDNPFDYYRTLFNVTIECTYDMNEREFGRLSPQSQQAVIEDAERFAFLPPKDV